MSDQFPELLTVQEAAEMLRVNVAVFRRIYQPEIKVVDLRKKLGGRPVIRIPKKNIEKFLAQNTR